jgi:hypothetical protein
MNRIIITLLAAILLLSTACQSKKNEIVIVPDVQKNHLERLHLKGDVQNVVTKQYLMLDSGFTRPIATLVQNYSLDGFLKQTIILDEQDDTVRIRTVFYDNSAHETLWIERNLTGDTLEMCLYEYDMNRLPAAEKYYNRDSLIYTITYKCDGEGNVRNLARNNGQFTVSNKMHYNESGLISRIDEYDPNGKLYKFVTIEYDNYGDEVNRKAFKSENHLIEYTYTKYDSTGKLMKIIYEDRLHGNRETSEYNFHDAQGNWLKEDKTVADKNIHYIKERTITYYKH